MRVELGLTFEDMHRMTPDELQQALDTTWHEAEMDAVRDLLFVAPPLTYVSPVRTEVAPASRWQRERLWLRRLGR